MQIDLRGKLAIVTGAGRGIGREIATTLASEGAITVVTDVRQELLDDVRIAAVIDAVGGRQGGNATMTVRSHAIVRSHAASVMFHPRRSRPRGPRYK